MSEQSPGRGHRFADINEFRAALVSGLANAATVYPRLPGMTTLEIIAMASTHDVLFHAAADPAVAGFVAKVFEWYENSPRT